MASPRLSFLQTPALRRVLVAMHRWVGLGTAIFLFIAGLTGALISWEREVDHWLNPQIFKAESGRREGALSVYELADRVEREDSRLEVNFLPLSYHLGHTAIMYVSARLDPRTGKPYELGFNQIFVDPGTGKIQGQRNWGELSRKRECWVPLIYRLHYSLHLPGAWGIWLMGIVAMAWSLDCFVALVLSFPSPKVWRKSFAFRLKQGIGSLFFDLHRSSGVWLWLWLLVMALTSVSMNLGDQVVKPCIALIWPVRPEPAEPPIAPRDPTPPAIGREAIVRLAQTEARRMGLNDRPGALAYDDERGTYGVGFFNADEDHAGHGEWGWQPAWLTLNGQTGALLAQNIPGTGSFGDHLLDLQFPLHSGRLAGTTGKAIVSFLGLVVAMLSATGVYLWARRQARLCRMRAELASQPRTDHPAP